VTGDFHQQLVTENWQPCDVRGRPDDRVIRTTKDKDYGRSNDTSAGSGDDPDPDTASRCRQNRGCGQIGEEESA
jgi:hypothetical protein